jgi:FkbM family methyltransferase
MKANFEFRAGTCDANVFRSVVELNEYALPDTLAADELILDIGAHIGSFTQACLDRGARRIMAFEPDPENFQRLRRHLAPEIGAGWVSPLPCAVTSSSAGLLVLSEYLVSPEEVNTGGACVRRIGAGRLVPSLNIESVTLALSVGAVQLLKLDCEGSEWGILHRLFCRPDLALPVAAVCGEYHPGHEYRPEELRPWLVGLGFDHIRTRPHGESGLGLFWASRGTDKFKPKETA